MSASLVGSEMCIRDWQLGWASNNSNVRRVATRQRNRTINNNACCKAAVQTPRMQRTGQCGPRRAQTPWRASTPH
eukprot:14582338-Alexandrium_andersonii.AAC.1